MEQKNHTNQNKQKNKQGKNRGTARQYSLTFTYKTQGKCTSYELRNFASDTKVFRVI